MATEGTTPPPLPPDPSRVKVYDLNAAGQWDDKGTGHIQWTRERGHLVLVVRSEAEANSGAVLLEHVVNHNIDYQCQSKTIITWTERDPHDDSKTNDCALSFQEEDGCIEVWNRITSAQSAVIDLMDDDRGLLHYGRPGEYDSPESQYLYEMGREPTVNLPFPELSNISEIRDRIIDPPQSEKENIATILAADGFVPRLHTLFETAEDLDQMDQLQVFFHIFKSMFFLNDMPILEAILSEASWLKTVGALEYDPADRHTSPSTTHRDFLQRAQWKQIIPVDKEIQDRIHQAYRLSYIKDVILLRYLDEVALQTVNQLLFFSNMIIVSRLTEDKRFQQLLGEKMRMYAKYDPPASSENKDGASTDRDMYTQERDDVFKYVRELCVLAKQLQANVRDQFYKVLAEGTNLFDAIETALSSAPRAKQTELWIVAADVINCMLLHDAALLRNHLVARLQQGGPSLFPLMLETCLDDQSVPGLANQMLDALRAVLDPASMHDQYKEFFLQGVYERFMHAIPSTLPLPDEQTGNQRPARQQLSVDVKAGSKRPPSPRPSAPAAGATGPNSAPTAQSGHQKSQSLGEDKAEQHTAPPRSPLQKRARPNSPEVAATERPTKRACSPMLAAREPQPIWDLLTPKFHACELLSFCVEKHGFRARELIKHHHVMKRVACVLGIAHQGKDVSLSALRFVRTCLGQKPAAEQDIFVKLMLHAKVFDRVMQLFVTNGNRYNLVNSVIVEIVDFIRTDNIKALITHLVERHEAKFKHITYVTTFSMLRLKYDQLKDAENTREAGTKSAAKALYTQAQEERDKRREEEYFLHSDDEEEFGPSPAASASSPSSAPSSSEGPKWRQRAHRSPRKRQMGEHAFGDEGAGGSGGGGPARPERKLDVDESQFVERKKEEEEEVDIMSMIAKRQHKSSAQRGAGRGGGMAFRGSGRGIRKAPMKMRFGRVSPPSRPQNSVKLELPSTTQTRLKLVDYDDDDDDDDDDDGQSGKQPGQAGEAVSGKRSSPPSDDESPHKRRRTGPSPHDSSAESESASDGAGRSESRPQPAASTPATT